MIGTLASVLIWGLFAVAMFLPAGVIAGILHPDESESILQAGEDVKLEFVVSGWDALMDGWRGKGLVPWSAKLALLSGWIALLSGRTRLATGLGTAAIALALTAPYFYEVSFAALRIGYYLWLGSSVVLAFTAILELTRRNKVSAMSNERSSTEMPA